MKDPKSYWKYHEQISSKISNPNPSKFFDDHFLTTSSCNMLKINLFRCLEIIIRKQKFRWSNSYVQIGMSASTAILGEATSRVEWSRAESSCDTLDNLFKKTSQSGWADEPRQSGKFRLTDIRDFRPRWPPSSSWPLLWVQKKFGVVMRKKTSVARCLAENFWMTPPF